MASTPFQMKRSNVAGKIPLYTDLEVGEIAIQLADKKIFTRGTSNNIIQIGDTHKYVKEWHVDPVNGSDTDGTGAQGAPYATIGKALNSAGNTGCAVILHAGTYSDTVTVTNLNVDIIGNSAGGIVYMSGAWTFNNASSSVRVFGLSFGNTVTISASGGTYFHRCYATSTVSKTGTGYTEIRDCDFGGAGVGFTSAATTLVKDSIMYLPVVNNANATVSFSGCSSILAPNINLGVALIDNSFVYSAANTSNAITGGTGSITYLYNSHLVAPNGTTARVSLPTGALWSINDTQFDKANSNVTGTNLGTVNYFDAINVTGNVTLATLPTGNTYQAESYLMLDNSNNVVKISPYYPLQPVLENTVTTPPSTPATNDRYLVPAGSSGAWSTFANQIVTWSGSAWNNTACINGDTVVVTTGANAGKQYTFNGTAWNTNSQAKSVRVTQWALNASYSSGAIAVKDGLLYQATGAIAANTAFATGVAGAKWKLIGGSGSGSGNAISNGNSNVSIASSDGNITMAVAGVANIATIYGNSNSVVNASANTNVTTTLTTVSFGNVANLTSNVVSNANSQSNVTTTTTTNLLTVGSNTQIKYANVANINVANTSNAYYPVVIDSAGVLSKQPVVAVLASVIDNTLTAPPSTPAVGDSYLVAATATGDWATKENKIATYDGSAWQFYTPQNNDTTTVTGGINAGVVYIYKTATTSWSTYNTSTPLTVSNWLIGVSYTSGAIVAYNNGLYQANSNIPANTAFSVGTTGATWKLLSSAGTMPAEYGQQLLATDISGPTTNTGKDILSFTLPSAGTWEVTYVVATNPNVNNQWYHFYMTDSGGNVVAGSESPSNLINTSAYGSAYDMNTQTVRITTTGSAVYTLRIWQDYTVGTAVTIQAANKTKVLWKKLNGFMPATGSIAEYGETIVPSSINLTSTAWTDIISFTLPSAGVWEIQYSMRTRVSASGSYIICAVTDNSNNAVSNSQTIGDYAGVTGLGDLQGTSGTTVRITTTGSATYKIRAYASASGSNINSDTAFPGTGLSKVVWKQLGSTNVSAFLGTLSNDYSINNAYPSGAIVTKNSLLYQANQAIPANTVWVEGTSGQTWKQIGGGVVAEQGQMVAPLATDFTLTSSYQAIPGITFTAATSGTYEMSAFLPRGGGGFRPQVTIAINGIVQDGLVEHFGYGAYESGMTAIFVATLTQGQVVTVVAKSFDGSGTIMNNNGGGNYDRRPSLRWKKISGFVPVTGSVTGYARYKRTAIQSALSANSVIACDVQESLNGTGISANTNTGTITLTAGNTYRLRGAVGDVIGSASGSYASFQWWDLTNSAWVGSVGATYSPTSSSWNSSTSPVAEAVITPGASNVTYQLRLVTIGNSSSVGTAYGYPWYEIEQLGTTSTSAFTGTLSNQWSINNSYPSGTIVNNGGFLYQANQAITAGTAFATGTTGATWALLNIQQAEYNEQRLTTDLTLTSNAVTDAVTFTLPTAGTWDVEYSASVYVTVSTGGVEYMYITDTANNVYGNSQRTVGGSAAVTTDRLQSATGVIRITTTGATTYKLRVHSTTASTRTWQAYNTGVVFKKVSGFLPLQPKTFTEKLTIGAVTTAPTKPTVVDRDYATLIDDNTGWCQFNFDFVYTNATGALAGTGDYLITLPAGYQFDTVAHPTDTGTSVNWLKTLHGVGMPIGNIYRSSDGVYSNLVAIPYNATQFRLYAASGSVNGQFISAGWFQINSSTGNFRLNGQMKFKKA